jgi:hypothetical protein
MLIPCQQPALSRAFEGTLNPRGLVRMAMLNDRNNPNLEDFP